MIYKDSESGKYLLISLKMEQVKRNVTDLYLKKIKPYEVERLNVRQI